MTLFNSSGSLTLLLTLDVNNLMIDEKKPFLKQDNQMLITFEDVNKLGVNLKINTPQC